MAMMRECVLAAVLLVELGAALGAQRPQCTGTEMGPAQPLLTTKGRPVFLEAPSIVPLGKDIGLFSRMTIIWENDRIVYDTSTLQKRLDRGDYDDPQELGGVLMHADGRVSPLPRPKGLGEEAGLTAVSDGAKGAWAAWANAKDSAGATVSIAHFANGAWHEERELAKLRFLYDFSLSMTLAQDGNPIVVVSATDRENPITTRGALVLIKTSTGWQRSWIPNMNLPASFTQVAATKNGIVVVQSGSTQNPGEKGPSSGVYVSRSADNGKTWTSWSRISAPRDTVPNWPWLRAEGDTLHLIWVEFEGGDAEDMLYSTSRDGGITWTIDSRSAIESLKSYTAIKLAKDVRYIGVSRANEFGMVDLRRGKAPVVTHLPWQSTSLPPRAAITDSARALIVLGQKVPGAYPDFPQYDGRRSSIAWMPICRGMP